MSGAEVLINEIMYHPSSEQTGEEYIELYNPGTNSVSLAGWRFSKGISLVFSNNAVIQPGGYLVLVANRGVFQIKYPNVTNVVGDWQGVLSNQGEEIELENAMGQAVDSVTYADEGDWALRERGPLMNGHRGWEWLAEHDGLGKSLELVSPQLSNNSGQSWLSSTRINGTPGEINSVTGTNHAPLILDTYHSPAIPASTDSVAISATVLDEQPGVTVLLFHRNASTTTPSVFSSAPMFDDGQHNDGVAGDSIYGAVLPAQPARTVTEFYVRASDVEGRVRTWPAAARQENGLFAQTANALYQVDDSTYTGAQPMVRLVMTEAERAELADFTIRQTDAQMNATWIGSDGTGTQIRYNVGVRIRGAGSRNAAVPNYRVNLPTDRRWKGVNEVNLNAQFGYLQVIGSALAQRAGLATANVRAAQVRVNAQNLVGSGGRFFGSYALVEAINADYAENHFPNDADGNLYRGSTGAHSAGLNYLGTNSNNYIGAGYSKSSNASEDDWSDLFHLTDVLGNTPEADYAERVQEVANVELWMRYFAVFTLLQSMETSMGTGRGDDYAMYRGRNDPRFLLLPHDLDTIFGDGDTPVGPTAHIFRMVPLVGQPMPPHQPPNVTMLNRFMLHPEFVPIYFRELKRLIDTTFSPAELEPLVDKLLANYVPGGTLTALKNFAVARNASVLSQIPLSLTVNTALPITNGYPVTTAGFVTLNGRANGIETRSVRVNGSPASWTAWQGNWAITNLALRPGLNRVLVQSFDGNGAETERTTIDLWYNDNSVINAGGTLTNDAVWLAASGPYVVTNHLTVGSGRTLTIEPGTSVYLGANINVTVANGGRLIAEGTDTARIRFTRQPGSATRWGGITINGGAGSPETRITYAHLEFNGSEAIHSQGGTVFLGGLTFGSTDRQYVSLDGSSFVVSECVFPTATAPFELVHGTQGIKAGGRGIFVRNFFGAPNGYNDTVDFTGGNRPGPVVHFIDNVFVGSDDDILDLDSTDAWVEGNIFVGVHRNGSPDSASVVSGGNDDGQASEITIIGNIFYDCDQTATAKQGNFYTLINNTIVRQTREGGVDSDAAVINLADEGTTEGSGFYLEGNVIYDAEKLVRNQTAATVTFTNNLMPLLWQGPGGGNSTEDPRLKHIPQPSETLFTSWAQAQVMRDWFSLLPGSPARGAGPNGRDQGGVSSLGVSIAGEPRSATRDSTATLTAGVSRSGSGIPATSWPNGSGYTHYRFRLDGGPWSAEASLSVPISLTGLGNGLHRVEVVGKRDSGLYQDDPAFGVAAVISMSRTWSVNTNLTGQLRINEVLARNSTAVPIGGEFPDMVELHNGTASDIDLSGMGLSDEARSPFKFTFPFGTRLGAGQYLSLQADSEGGSGVHLGFAINQRGGGLYLFDPAGMLVDSVVFGPQAPDLSIGRLADGNWGLTRPTFGSANLPQALGDPTLLKINEWLADGSGLFPDDFIELFNPEPLPVDLTGLYLTDAPDGAPRRSPIPSLTFMSGFGHLAFIADGNPENGPDHVNFQLAAEQGAIGLFSASKLIECILYGSQTTGVSEGRKPSGSSTFAFFGPATQTQPTPNAPNPGDGGSVSVTNLVVGLIALTNGWNYEASGTDLATAWREKNFDDSAWLTGTALFHNENNTSIPFRNTLLPFTVPQQITFYFRTKFVVSTNLDGFTLRASTYIDDGAVFYLNGSEVLRVRMPEGPIAYSTLASASPPDGDAVLETFTIPGAALMVGTNVLAVEVHQQIATSSDVVWGMAFDAVRPITNVIALSAVLNEVMANNRTYTNADGTITDWVELFNPLQSAVELSNQSLSDDVANPRRWVFPTGTTVPARGYLVVRFDPNSPAVTNAASLVLGTGFGLGANGDEVYLFDTPARGGALLDSIAFGFQPPDYSIGRVGGAAWTLTLPTPGSVNIAAGLSSPTALRINEWMADAGSSDDWIEIFNPNNQPVALGGLSLTDNLNDRARSPIPPLSFISHSTNGFVQFLADNNPQNGANHVRFRLDNDGEAIGLFNANGGLIDAITFGAQQRNVSEGRLPDGSSNTVRFAITASPAESNYLPLSDVVINEALTHSDLPLEDAIELHNMSAEAIGIGGWYLSDSNEELTKFRIPDGTIIPPGGFAVFYEAQFNPEPGLPPGFALSSGNGDQIYLSVADAAGNLTGYRGTVNFKAAENGVSFGRYETSAGADFTAMTQRTLGADQPATVVEFRQGGGRTNGGPKVGPVVFNEIMYHPPDVNGTNDNVADEFLELHNLSPAEVHLFDPQFPANTWRLRDAVDFDFPTNTVVPANGFLVLVSFDPVTDASALAAFRSHYGPAVGVRILGPYRGKLDNSSDSVELYKPDSPQSGGAVPYVLVDRVKYSDTPPWPTAADSGTNNLSLQRRNAADYGNDPVNWVAGAPTTGAANGAAVLTPPSITAQPNSQSVPPGTGVTLTASVVGTGPLLYQWRLNGMDIPGATSPSLTLANVQLGQSGTYRIRVSNPAGAAISSAATLTVQIAPSITQQPQDRIVAPGGTATFSVGARGTAPLVYQWRRNGSNIPGATNHTLIVTNVQAVSQGDYAVVITNAHGSIASAVARLVINDPPMITLQPGSQTVLAGSQVTLQVGAAGSPPLAYQWSYNGIRLSGETAAQLVLTNAQPGQSGRYSVRVSNAVGSVMSSEALVTVIALPTLIVSAVDANASESVPNPGAFLITRVGSTNFPVSVNFSLAGSASVGVDYQPIASPVAVPAGVVTATLEVTPINDALRESVETVFLRLLAAPGYIVGAPDTATVVISDDDNARPSISLTAPSEGGLYPITPTNILMAASAGDSDGSVRSVQFFNHGTNLLGEVTSAPFQFAWTNAPFGSNRITAVAVDDLEAATTSASLGIYVNFPPTAEITSPFNGAAFSPPTNITVMVNAMDADGEVARVDFYQGVNLVGSDPASPYTVTLTNLDVGTHTLSARAIDNRGMSSISSVIAVVVRVPSAGFADMFAERGDITGYFNTLAANNAGATREPAEPRAYAGSSRTMWLRWVAPANGVCTLHTIGSAFDTVLAVFTNNPPHLQTLGALGLLAENDDFINSQSYLTFNVVEDTAYQIRVEGFGSGDAGAISFVQFLATRAPHVIVPPRNILVGAGANVTNTFTATSLEPYTNQWRLNGINIPRATNATLALTNVQLAAVGEYTVIVGNAYGFDISVPGRLEIGSRPILLVHPQSQTAVEGSTVTMRIIVSGTLPMSYLWRRGNQTVTNMILNSHTSVLTIPNLRTNDAGIYRVAVTNIIGIAGGLSQSAVLTVLTDADRDGMPDFWESANNFAMNDPEDAGRDADGDFMTNVQEYIAGTDPHDERSYLKVDRVTPGAGLTLIEFAAVSNKTYSVLHSELSPGSSWSRLADVAMRTTNRTEIILDAAPPPGKRFYRLVTPQLP